MGGVRMSQHDWHRLAIVTIAGAYLLLAGGACGGAKSVGGSGGGSPGTGGTSGTDGGYAAGTGGSAGIDGGPAVGTGGHIGTGGGDAGGGGGAAGSGTGGDVPMRDTSPGTLSLVAGGLGGPGYANGTGTDARFYFPDDLVSDGQGNLFVSDRNNDTIRKVVIATGEVTTLAGSPGVPGSADGTGSGARFNWPQTLAIDGEGNLFVADRNNHTIRKVVIATGVTTTLPTSSQAVGLAQDVGLAADGAGRLFVAVACSIQVVAVATGVVTTLAGSGSCGTPGIDGVGAAATFSSLTKLVSDRAGNLLVTDDQAIRKVVIATGEVTTLAGFLGGAIGIGSTDGTGSDARFYSPSGLASDGAGNLFVADTGNDTIRKLAIATGEVTTIAGSEGVLGSTDGIGVAARFSLPRCLTSDGLGNLFVSDDNHTIRKLAAATGEVTTFVGSHALPGSTDGRGSVARFHGPVGLTSDGTGSLFVGDVGNNMIRKVVIATGVATKVAGGPGRVAPSYSGDGTGAAASFSSPSWLTSDGMGNLFVADTYNHTIRRVVTPTGEVTTVAGLAGYLAENIPGAGDGVGAEARFNWLQGLVGDGAGNLFVVDLFAPVFGGPQNYTIRRVAVETGEVTTSLGSPEYFVGGDSPGAEHFWGLAIDGASTLYVADSLDHVIRKVVIATGEATTLAGSLGVPGSTDGTGEDARFNFPSGLAIDAAGNLFVADTNNSTIRKVVVATGVVTTVVSTPGRGGVALGALPAALNRPLGLALGATGSLFITDENSVLEARPRVGGF
jgi:sugar lactone lactonase YvrE